jgi:1,4-alpha-glucan branching enzyme
LLYAFQENFILPLSHDEVVHGKGPLIHKIPGDEWQRFATLRAYLAFMFAHPGKKLLFMGDEFAQTSEWNHDIGLDWPLLQWPVHRGVQSLVKDLNRLYRDKRALHELDCESAGFAWIDCHDSDASVMSFMRGAKQTDDFVIAVCNFTPVVREAYRIGAPTPGVYREVLNTDSEYYGGGNVGNWGALETEGQAAHGFAQSLRLRLPPLATLLLSPDSQD